MTIWVRLGISVAVAAMFSIVMTAFLQSTSYYEAYRWYLCVGLLGVGPLVYFVGRKLNADYARAKAQEDAALGFKPEGGEKASYEPFLLFNLAYWGVMLMIFGIIIIFIVPRNETFTVAAPQPPVEQVAARQPPPPVPEEPPMTNTPPVEFPEVRMQGLFFNRRKPSVIFDGHTYRIGDAVRGAKIVKISSRSVTLELGGQFKVLDLEKELLKAALGN